jgi:hypothetical protein
MTAAVLHERPEFPVFGLSAAFPGMRWLDGWTAQGARRGTTRLWQVDLGHCRPERNSTVIVVSDAKLRASSSGQPSTGLRDAAVRALRGAYALSGLSGNVVALRGESARLESARPLDELGWIRFRSVVESETREFVTRTVGLAWAAAVDLGDVAVGMYGIGATLDECVLARVNDRLGDYQPLPDDQAQIRLPAVPDLSESDFQKYSVERVAYIAQQTSAQQTSGPQTAAEPTLGAGPARPRHQRVRVR